MSIYLIQNREIQGGLLKCLNTAILMGPIPSIKKLRLDKEPSVIALRNQFCL